MSELNYQKMMEIDGSQDHEGRTIRLLPKAWIELQIEILQNHPKLAEELARLMQQESGDVNVWYGAVGAYLGIVLDGAYSQEQLIEQFSRGLIAKREGIAVGIGSADIVPMPKELLQ